VTYSIFSPTPFIVWSKFWTQALTVCENTGNVGLKRLRDCKVLVVDDAKLNQKVARHVVFFFFFGVHGW
jgi:hypothetical protein